jgi:nucleotide-binding universal stress UspA family protein
MIKNILCATDLGVYSPYLLQHVLAIAAPLGAQVNVLHVVSPLGIFAESIIDTYLPDNDKNHLRLYGVDQVMKSIKDRVMVMLEGELVEPDTGVCVLGEVDVVTGVPANVILKQAENSEFDLIVMGANSTHGESGFVLGSVAHKVCQASRVPVMLVPMGSLPGI